jgi:hypothetical protein
MDGDTTQTSFMPVDVHCCQPGCVCDRRVPGIIVTEGYAIAPEAGTQCPACQHPWNNHEPLGISKGPVDTEEPSI